MVFNGMIMEEGKKKRWRPSLTEYRALERKVAELHDVITLTEREYGDALHAYAKKKEEFARLEDALKKAVDHASSMEWQLNVEKGLKESAYRQIEELRSRGFWRRVFNR